MLVKSLKGKRYVSVEDDKGKTKLVTLINWEGKWFYPTNFKKDFPVLLKTDDLYKEW